MKYQLVLTALLALTIHGQPPAFEVASIRLNTSGGGGGSMGPRGSGFFASNMPLRNLILYANTPPDVTLRNSQLIGGPDWTITDHFDIEAKAPEATPAGQFKAMLRTLLEERFQLKLHQETRELPVYNLVPAKRGPRLSADQTPPDPRQSFLTVASEGQPLAPLPRGAIRLVTGPVNTTLEGTAVQLSLVITLLQGRADRIILDKTNLASLIDVNLHFSQDQSGENAEPALFTALQETGLKLESAKAPLPVLVIDSVRHPSEN